MADQRRAIGMAELNKDYLSEKEAAAYCCVSLQHFHRQRSAEGIACIRHMGKKLYRKSDLIKSIEKYAVK